MCDGEFKYLSAQHSVNEWTGASETNSRNGITCTWRAELANGLGTTSHSWRFNWKELKEKGVTKLTGFILVKRPLVTPLSFKRIEVELTDYDQLVVATIDNSPLSIPILNFECCLTPHYGQNEEISYDDMFAPSEINDVVLVVEGKKLHVNKAFLSIHSEFFRALFSANFKEGQMNEIPIEEVSYEDFGLLMSTIYPDTVFPTDGTVEKLLELADRFLMKSVISHVEHHLMNMSKIGNIKMLWMADRYRMKKLLEKSIFAMDSVEKVKNLRKSEEYKSISDATKVTIFERLAEFN